MGNSRIIINTIEDSLLSSAAPMDLEIGLVLKAPRGPVGRAVKVTTEQEILAKFGTPTSAFPVLDAASYFLRSYQGLNISRVALPNAVASSVQLLATNAVALVKVEGNSISSWENGFTLTVSESGSSNLLLVLSKPNGTDPETYTVLEALQVPAGVTDLVSEINASSEYLIATELAAGTLDSTAVYTFANGVDGSVSAELPYANIVDAIKVFDSPLLGKLNIIAAPGLLDVSNGSAWAQNTAYEIGDAVVADGISYYCTTNHTSNNTEGGAIADDIANWETLMAHLADELVAVADTRLETLAIIDFAPAKSVADVLALSAGLPTVANAAYYHKGVKMRLSAGQVVVPAAMAALFVHAAASQVSPWASPAGFSANLAIPYVSGYLTPMLTAADAETLYAGAVGPAINPIVYDNSVGWVIDGQRTGAAPTEIRRSLGIEKVVETVKYNTNAITKPFQYKPNTQATWDSWKLQMKNYLNNLATLGAISSFEVFMGTNTMTQEEIQNGILKGLVRIVPAFITESIEITIYLRLEA